MQLRPYQLNCLSASLKHYQAGMNRQLAVLATGLGKCLGKGTPVLMFDGTIRPVEEIRVGDLLMGPDSGPRLVKSLARGREEMFRVIPVKGEEYVVNRSHILSLKMTPRGTRYPSYHGKRVDISVAQYVKQTPTFKHMAKGWRTGVEFSRWRDLALLPSYFLGLWLGDGDSKEPRITTGDKEVVEYLFELEHRYEMCINTVANSQNSKTYRMNKGARGTTAPDGNPIVRALRKYGLIGNKHIPHRYLTGSRQERLEVLAGILDTDEHLASRGCYDLCLKSERLLDDTIFVARSLGFAAYKKAQKKTCVNNGKVGDYFRCTISGDVDEIPCKIPHKQSRPRRQKKNHLVTGISVESIGDGEYFGFEIAGPDRLFLLGDFTVTHNTAIASSVRSHHGFGKKILFLVHMETLAVQAAHAMERWNPDLSVGVEMAGSYADLDGMFPPVFIVASVPTLGRKGSERIKRFDPFEFDCVIQDEAHIGVSDSFKRVYDHFGLLTANPDGVLFLGITATPNRSDGRGLRELFDVIVFDMDIQKGIAEGWLCDIRAMRIKGHADLDGVHVRGGKLADDELEKAVNTPKRNGIIVKEWYKHAYGRRTIWFTVDVQHALDLAEAFKAHGVPARAVWGDDPEREQKIAGHKAGEYEVICCAKLLGIGYDDPLIRCIGLAAPRGSIVQYTQEVGRGTRIADGKDDLLVIDVCDNTSRHNICSISSLLGLPKDLDLKGEKYSTAKERLERVAKEFPTANIQDIKSLDQLKSIAENVALFQVAYPPEVNRLSELAWRKSGDGYMLAVKRDLITINKDLRDEYQIVGNLEGQTITLSAQNLSGAFNVADSLVSREIVSVLKREARWHGDMATENQIYKCRKLGIPIYPGMTKGAASNAITAKEIQMRPRNG